MLKGQQQAKTVGVTKKRACLVLASAVRITLQYALSSRHRRHLPQSVRRNLHNVAPLMSPTTFQTTAMSQRHNFRSKIVKAMLFQTKCARATKLALFLGIAVTILQTRATMVGVCRWNQQRNPQQEPSRARTLSVLRIAVFRGCNQLASANFLLADGAQSSSSALKAAALPKENGNETIAAVHKKKRKTKKNSRSS